VSTVLKTVRTDNLEIGCLISGPIGGQPLVAVHGWPDSPRCWEALLPEWHAAGFQVFRPYLRGFGPTRFRSESKIRSGQIGALGRDLADLLDVLDLHDVLLVGHDWGARAAYVVGALYPERLNAIVAISAGHSTNTPTRAPSWPLASAYWYEWLVATEVGRRAIDEDRQEFCRYLWDTWSPDWQPDPLEFDLTSESWKNQDWSTVTTHAYLHRWDEASGDPEYDSVERALIDSPEIKVRALVIHGQNDADNLPHTSDDQSPLFAAGYNRVVLPGVGHFPPRESPAAVATAIRQIPIAGRR
jgi:pimeloyl-ACP methyl ester carboxylesterase